MAIRITVRLSRPFLEHSAAQQRSLLKDHGIVFSDQSRVEKDGSGRWHVKIKGVEADEFMQWMDEPKGD